MTKGFPGKIALLFSPRWEIELALKHQFCQQDKTGTLVSRHAGEFINIVDASEHVLPDYGEEKKIIQMLLPCGVSVCGNYSYSYKDLVIR